MNNVTGIITRKNGTTVDAEYIEKDESGNITCFRRYDRKVVNIKASNIKSITYFD